MFIAILEKILAALGEIPDFKTVDVWQGEIKDLLDTVQKLPSAWVLFSGGDFDEATTIGGTTIPHDLLWSIIILAESRRDRQTGARETLALLNTLLNPAVPASPDITPGLVRLNTGHGLLWPVTVQLLGSENGKTAYGFKFAVEKGRNQR